MTMIIKTQVQLKYSARLEYFMTGVYFKNTRRSSLLPAGAIKFIVSC